MSMRCRGIGLRLQPVRGAQLVTAGLSSLGTGMAVHPHTGKLQSARKLVAMLPAHRGVAVAAAAVAIPTELSSTQPSLTPRGAYPFVRPIAQQKPAVSCWKHSFSRPLTWFV